MSTQLSKEEITRMQKIHSDFISQTDADPALAQDLLDATEWDLQAALQAFQGLSETHTEQSVDQFEDIDVSTMGGLLGGDVGVVKEEEPIIPEEGSESDIKKRPKKKGRAKGLGHVADSVEDMFLKVAVSESKLKAGATKKERSKGND